MLDTGPIVTYLDATDPGHSCVVNTLDTFEGQLHTTCAVVTESMHFLGSTPQGPQVLVEFLASSGVQIAECTQFQQLREAALLMRKYLSTPMDFADATLVLLAQKLQVYKICTLDRRGFTTYRTPAGKHFTLAIQER